MALRLQYQQGTMDAFLSLDTDLALDADSKQLKPNDFKRSSRSRGSKETLDRKAHSSFEDQELTPTLFCARKMDAGSKENR